MILNQYSIPTDDGLTISITQWVPEKDGKYPVVLFIPGLKGFTNWGSFPHLCEQLCQSGRAVLSMGFSCDGVENFGNDITRPNNAQKLSVTREMEECIKVIEKVRRGDVPQTNKIDATRLFILAHSLGGAVALKLAEEYPTLRIQGVITWSSIAQLNLWPADVIDDWEREGKINMPNARTGQDYYLGRDFLAEVKDTERFNLSLAVKSISIPLLILHGNHDETVPVQQAKELFNAAKDGQAELHIISGGDHNFGAVHPFQGSTPALDDALDKTITWLDKQ